MRIVLLGFVLFFATGVLAQAATPAIDSGGTPLDLTHIALAHRASYHGRYTEAISRASAVIAHAPGFAGAYFDRAEFYAEAGRYAEAEADLVQVDAFHPDATQTALLRVEIALRQHDATRALAQLAHAAKSSPLTFWKQSYEGEDNAPGTGYLHVATQHTISYSYAYASIADEMLGQDDAALSALQESLQAEPDKSYQVLARHCFYAAIVGLGEMAELSCNEAMSQQAHDIGDYDSLGLAHLKMKAWAKAIADYNKALYDTPDLTVSLYGRGIAKRASGDLAGGDADIAAAKRDEPDIVNIMAQMGVKPL